MGWSAGWKNGEMTNLLALQSGTDLVSDYRIERVLGAGGFGITYLASEPALERRVAIKEYFPNDFAMRGAGNGVRPRSPDCVGDFQWGIERFINEAQTLAKFDHANIVRVYRTFKGNDTAYMVLQFEEGQSLKSWLKGLGRAPRQREIDGILAPLLDALEVVHKADFLHRDIAPDNIIIRQDGTPVLIDFGAARGELAAYSKTVSALVKPGYSPYEQYAETSRQQGPWSDIYALGATLYHAITGKRPPDAPSRLLNDELVPAREAALAGYRQGFLAAVDAALALNVEARPQSVAAWRGPLLAPDPRKPNWLTRAIARRRRDQATDAAADHAGGGPGAAVPPPPDAPGPHGRMLDFIDGLKHKSDAAPAADTPGQGAGVSTSRSAKRPGSETTVKLSARAAPETKPAAEPTAKGPRPRPVRSGHRIGSWRPLLVKLLIGAGVAAAAVGLQEQVPRVESRAAPTVTPASPNAASARLIHGHRGPATAVAFTDDGRQLISGSRDATLRIWNAGTGALLRTVELDNGAPTALAVSARRALTGHGDGTIVIWDLDTGEKHAVFRRSDSGVVSLAFLGEGARFAAGYQDQSVAVWELRTPRQPAYVLEGHDGPAQALTFSAPGPFLASGSTDRTVKLWSASSQGLVRTYRGHRDTVSAVGFTPDGKILATGAHDGGIRLWSTSSNRLYRAWTGHAGKIAGLSFSPAGDLLASVGDDGAVRLWDFKRGRIARVMTGHIGVVRAVAYAPDGRGVASAGEDGTLRIWDAIFARTTRDQRD